ncbi:hypothetical protein CCH79_00013622, partial [Gambusia affinis]
MKIEVAEVKKRERAAQREGSQTVSVLVHYHGDRMLVVYRNSDILLSYLDNTTSCCQAAFYFAIVTARFHAELRLPLSCRDNRCQDNQSAFDGQSDENPRPTLQKTWGTVCDNGWDMNDAQVVCRQLGCGTALAAPHSAYFGKGMDKIWVDNVNCTGMETYLTECPFSGFQTYSRSHSQDAGVICSAGVLRLVGLNRCSGRVEIYNNGSWATVCNVSKDFNDGRVICRQLGCGTALGLLHFGEGAGQIWLDDWICETRLRIVRILVSSVRFVKQPLITQSFMLHIFPPGLMKPTITINPRSNIAIGQNVNITCLVPNGQVGGTFIFNRTSDRFGQTVESNSNSGTFYIPQIGFEHEGTYQCQFHTRVSSEDFSTDISSPPNITIQPIGVVMWGQDVQITCSISGGEVEGSSIFTKTPGPFTQTVNSSSNSATLYIPKVTFTDEGDYQCQFKVRISSIDFSTNFSSDVPLYIKVFLQKPNITLDPAGLVSIGQTVNITCSVSEGQEGGSFIFKKTSGPIIHVVNSSSSSASFQINQVSLVDHGSYQCQFQRKSFNQDLSTNLSDSIQLNVIFPKPSITIEPTGVVTSGQVLQIYCLITGGEGGESMIFTKTSVSVLLCLSSAAASNIVRLVGSGSDGYCVGRVEIYHDGEWGTVCDDYWDSNDANVVCKQLGCGPSYTVHTATYFGEGTGRIWLDDINCLGKENSPSECNHRGFGIHNCDHQEDAGVTCYCNGSVHLYHDVGWHLLGYNSFDMNAANVACRQMGCGPATSISESGPYYSYSYSYGYSYSYSSVLPDLSCSGSEFSLEECQHSKSGTYQTYSYTQIYCSDYPVRLTGPSRCAGRVEIYYNGWQTVCDDGWDLNDAQVVCSQLNCGVAMAAPHSAYFGKGSDKTLLDDVACTGNELHLTRCSHRGFWVQNCTHNQDAGVICSAGLSRLIGPSRCSGRVEIFNNGSWGTVCNNSWDINEARVICRQLGCGTSLSVLHFGEGIGEITEVTCTGSERYLPECSYSSVGAHNCNHSQDAGVICSGPIRPTIGLTPQGDITLGHNVSISCSITDAQVRGIFVLTKTTGSFSRAVNSSSSSATFNILQATFNDQGLYKCQLQIILPNENFTTLFSDTVQLRVNNNCVISLVIFPTPRISIEPSGVITFNQDVRMVCLVTNEQGGGSFIFRKSSGSFTQTVNSSSNSATLYIPKVTFTDQGDYQCQFKVRISNEDFSTSFSSNLSIGGKLGSLSSTFQRTETRVGFLMKARFTSTFGGILYEAASFFRTAGKGMLGNGGKTSISYWRKGGREGGVNPLRLVH